MKIIYASDVSSDFQALVQQGAGAIAVNGEMSAGLWFDHTPIYDGARVGAIGGCSIDPSLEASAFLSDCAAFLHEEYQLKTIIGPMNGNTWLQHRLILDSDERAPFLMEPFEPQYFLEAFSNAGFEVLSRYRSSSVDLSGKVQSLDRLTIRFDDAGVGIRGVDLDNFESDLEKIYHLSVSIFSENFLYTPISKDLFMGKYLEAKEKIDVDMVLLAECDGELVGFVFCMPDLLAMQRGESPALIVKTLGVKPERKFFGLGSLLVDRVHSHAAAKGYKEAIHALQHEANSSQRISKRFHAEVFRRYALMAKTF